MKKVLSVLLAAVLLIGMLPVGMVASAEGGAMQIDASKTYNVVWDASEEQKQLSLIVEETGFYDLTVDDNNKSASLMFDLYPADFESLMIYDTRHWFNEEITEYHYENLYLEKDREYFIDLNYWDYDYNYKNANIDISFSKNDYEPQNLELNGSCVFYNADNIDHWMTIKTTVAGDYLFTVSKALSGSFRVFEKATGEYVSAFSPTYYRKCRLNLDANKEYFLQFNVYDGGETYELVTLNYSKAEKDIDDIQIVQEFDILANEAEFSSTGEAYLNDGPEEFNYRVTYTDKTEEILWYENLAAIGAQVTYIEYLGDVYKYSYPNYDEYYLTTGDQAVSLWCMNKEFSSSIYIKPFVKWLDDIKLHSDFDEMYINYEDNEKEYTYYWRISPKENNMYEFYSSNWEEIYSEIIVFDKENRVVDRTRDGWKLTEGEEYALSITYTYTENGWLDVDFWMEPYREHIHNYTNSCDTDCNVCLNKRTAPHSFGEYVYNDDATSQKDGTKTRTCSVCKKTETVTATGTKLVNPFKDVNLKEYYAEPVLWAVGKKITNGMSANSFAPNNECTRGQIVTFLWRAAGSPEPTATKNPFVDVKSDAYYYKAVLWAVEKGITTGTSANTFSPDAGCTRGQVVTFLHRAKGKPAASASNAFADVKSGAYYYDAVRWAVKNSITNGMSATSFAPDATCTRGQIVTFLYRAYK